jgi:serine/threonine protein phosphatase PrpC
MHMPLKIVSFGLSDRGMKRRTNEDSLLLDDSMGIYAVADGMGGHLGGEVASRMAVDTVREVLSGPGKFKSELEGVDEVPLGILKYAFELSGTRIFGKGDKEEDLKGMGTTMTALYIPPGSETGCVAHVGDSRCYVVRDGIIRQVTDDHSWVGEQLRMGTLTPEQARTHSYRNVITRSIGFKEQTLVDAFGVEVWPGDAFMLCSDGLSNMLGDIEIQEIIIALAPEQACRELVKTANERGSPDNVTAVVVRLAGNGK